MKQKRIFHFLYLSILFVFAICCFIVYRSQNRFSSNNDITNSIIHEVDNLQELQPEQVAALLSFFKGVNYDQTLKNINNEVNRGIRYHKAFATYNFGESPDGTIYIDLVVKVNAVMKVISCEGNSIFADEDPVCVWVDTIHAKNCEWLEIYAPVIALSADNSISFRLRGSLIVPEDIGIDVEVLESKLNFLQTYTDDAIQYYRNTKTIFDIYTIENGQ